MNDNININVPEVFNNNDDENMSNDLTYSDDHSINKSTIDELLHRQFPSKNLKQLQSLVYNDNESEEADNHMTTLSNFNSALLTYVINNIPNTKCPSDIINKYLERLAKIEADYIKVTRLSKTNEDNNNSVISFLFDEQEKIYNKIAYNGEISLSNILFKINSLIEFLLNQTIIILFKSNYNFDLVLPKQIDVYHKLFTHIIQELKQDLKNSHKFNNSDHFRYVNSEKSSMNKSLTNIKQTLSIDENQYSDSMNIQDSDLNGPRHLSYNALTKIINSSYGNNPDTECSTSLDIIATYLKGLKVLYTEAKSYCEWYLYCLMIPAIVISALAGLFALLYTSFYGKILVAVLNTINALLLSLVAYLKLDAKSEAHRTSAYKYDKLETKCQFLSGKILFFDEDTANIDQVIDEIESKVYEAKEINQFVLPEYVRMTYPKTFSINIFSTVKKLFIEEAILKNKLKNVINDLRIKTNITVKSLEVENEIVILQKQQDILLENILSFKKKYLELDKILNAEIEKNVRHKKDCSIFSLYKHLVNILCCVTASRIINKKHEIESVSV